MHKIFFYNKCIIRLYMFRALCSHHQEVKIVLHSIWYRHTCRWPSVVQVERGLQSGLMLKANRRWSSIFTIISLHFFRYWTTFSTTLDTCDLSRKPVFLYLCSLVKLNCDLKNLLCAASGHYIYTLFGIQILVPYLGAALDVILCWHSCVFAVVYLSNFL